MQAFRTRPLLCLSSFAGPPNSSSIRQHQDMEQSDVVQPSSSSMGDGYYKPLLLGGKALHAHRVSTGASGCTEASSENASL